MMLRSGDLNLNQFGGSVKEAVKRTMIQHEIIFKNQVRELHRLYWTQKNLMQELYRKELAANNCRETSAFQSQVGGNVGCKEEVNMNFFGTSDSRRRGLGLELPANYYIESSANDSFNNGRVIGCSLMASPESSSKMHINESGGSMRPCLDKGKSLYCYEVINLEEPMETSCDVEAYRVNVNGLKVPLERSRVMGGFGSVGAPEIVLSSRVQNEPGLLPPLNDLHGGCGKQWQELEADHCALGGSETAADAVDPSLDSSCRQVPSSFKPILFDLNIAQDEEPFQGLNDPVIKFTSTSSCSSVVQNELLCRGQINIGWQKETSHASLLTPKESNSSSLSPDCVDSERSPVSDISQKQEHGMHDKVQGSTGQTTECYIKSAEGFSSGSNGELSNSAKGIALSSAGFSDLAEENGDLSSSRHDFFTQRDIKRQTSLMLFGNDLKNKQANREGSEEDTVSSHVVKLDDNRRDLLDKNLVSGRKSNAHTGSIQCSSFEKSTENSGTTQVENIGVETSQVQNTEQQQKETLAVVDAAEILANISLMKPSSPLEVENPIEDETEQPQYSADSFEAMTLELPEVQSDEHFISSLPIHSEDRGISNARPVDRLRRERGRAVRDFQKDILPGIISLSRHEICEDMHSIGYELRRNGSRRANGANWFMPVRSRRSRRYPLGRR